MEEVGGYQSEQTRWAKKKLIYLLVRGNKLEEALNEAVEYWTKMKSKVGYRSEETLEAHETLIGILMKTGQGDEAVAQARAFAK